MNSIFGSLLRMSSDSIANAKPQSDMLSEAPAEIDVTKFTAHRLKEIEVLKSDAIMGKDGKHKCLFQLLPRHMRRRTMGYIRKRLPKSIRSQSIIKPPNKANKRPSRKYRRRPKNLLCEYERRKRHGKMWLETHIWHAKRFHMQTKYGYRLAVHNNSKCLRQVYRNLNKYCVLHDESYFNCWQIDGTQEHILLGLQKLCTPETGLTFASNLYLTGRYEGCVCLYEQNAYPYKFIGEARFLWKSIDDDSSQTRTLWLWTHPGVYKQIEGQLLAVFDLIKDESVGQQPDTKKVKLNEEASDEKANGEHDDDAVYRNGQIRVKFLKNQFNRFKLLGPLSTTILSNVLKTIDLSGLDGDFTNNSELLGYLRQNLDLIRAQQDVWNRVRCVNDPRDVRSSQVLSLLVRDPRLILPKKKSFNTVRDEHRNNSLYTLDTETKRIMLMDNLGLAHTAIWNEGLIKELNEKKMSTFDINRERSKYLIPQRDLKLANSAMESKIPVLIVQHTNRQSLREIKNGSLGNGWDLIIPTTWSMAFWQACVHYGAKPIALNELNYLNFESGILNYPSEYHDCELGVKENDEVKMELYDRYLRRPASKRVNYLKLNYFNPFSNPYNAIVKLNSSQSVIAENPYYIIRNKRLLVQLSDYVFLPKHQKPSSIDTWKDHFDRGFVNVRLTAQGKGRIDKYAQIYASNVARPVETQTKQVKSSNLNSLISEDLFIHNQKTLQNGNELIGFVNLSKFTLCNGKYSANATIQLKHFVKAKNSLLVYYRNPNQVEGTQMNLAKIVHIFT